MEKSPGRMTGSWSENVSVYVIGGAQLGLPYNNMKLQVR